MGCSGSKGPVHPSGASGTPGSGKGNTVAPQPFTPADGAWVKQAGADIASDVAGAAKEAGSAKAKQAAAAAESAARKHADAAGSAVASKVGSAQASAASAVGSAKSTASQAVASANTAATSAASTANKAASSAASSANSAAASATSAAASASASASAAATAGAQAQTAAQAAAQRAAQKAAMQVQAAADLPDITEVLMTDRRTVSGLRCVITIGRTAEGVLVKAFHPTTEAEYFRELDQSELPDLLPAELQGEESELEQLRFIRDNLHVVDGQLDVIPAGGRPFKVLLTDRVKVSGKRCVITIGDREDGIVVRAFHPTTEVNYELVLDREEFSRMLPDSLQGEEQELAQLRFIRDNLQLIGSEDLGYELELVPPGGAPLAVLLRDRRNVDGRMAFITIGTRADGVVVRAFIPAMEQEFEQVLSTGQVRALLPERLQDEEEELGQLQWLSSNVHYTLPASGKVQIEVIPPEAVHLHTIIDPLKHNGPRQSDFVLQDGAGEEAGAAAAEQGAALDDSMMIVFRDRRRIEGKRVLITIGKRPGALVVRALNPASKHETELILPTSMLPSVVPAELLGEECEIEMLKHLAGALCFKAGSGKGRVLALQAEISGDDEAEAEAEAGEAKEDATLMQLKRDRRQIGGVRVYVTVGRRDGVLVVNVFSPSRQAEKEVALPVERLVHVAPEELLAEEVEGDLVNYLIDAVNVEPVGDDDLKMSVTGSPPETPAGPVESSFCHTLVVTGERCAVKAERRGAVVTFTAVAVDVEGQSTSLNVSLPAARAELSTGTAEERKAAESDEGAIELMASRLAFVKVASTRKLEIIGVTGPGPAAQTGYTETLQSGDDMYITTLSQRSETSISVTAVSVEDHSTVTGEIAMDTVAAHAASSDNTALLKKVHLQALLQFVAKNVAITADGVTYNPSA